MFDQPHARTQAQYISRALVILLYRSSQRIAKDRHAVKDLELRQRRKHFNPLTLPDKRQHTRTHKTQSCEGGHYQVHRRWCDRQMLVPIVDHGQT